MQRMIEILMIEDNPGDIELTKEAFSMGKLRNRLHVIEDGEEALNYIFRRGQHENAIRPDLILLDLNLPKVDGKTILEKVKTDDTLRTIPIIILSSSQDARDIQETYKLNANSFVTKPVKVRDFLNIVKSIEGFWVEIVKLPTVES